jgi:hypothetical protein
MTILWFLNGWLHADRKTSRGREAGMVNLIAILDQFTVSAPDTEGRTGRDNGTELLLGETAIMLNACYKLSYKLKQTQREE